jgi:hypothetical protein
VRNVFDDDLLCEIGTECSVGLKRITEGERQAALYTFDT